MKTLQKLILVCAIIVAVGCAILLSRSSANRLRLEQDLHEARDEIQRLQTKPPPISATELARLQFDQREAIKLRGEIVSLKQSLATAEATQKSNDAAQAQQSANAEPYLKVDPLPEDNPEVSVIKTKLINTTMESGQAIVLGGWESQPGKRAFVFIQPTRDPNSDQVSIVSKWAEFSDTAETRKNPFSLDTSGDQTATMPKISFDYLVKELENKSGIDLLSPPVVTTASGRQARISVTEERPTAQGPVEFGPKIDILPTFDANGHIQLAVQASLTQQPPQPERVQAVENSGQPKFRAVETRQ